MSASHPNERTPIIVQPSSWKTRAYDALEEDRVQRLIRNEILMKRLEPYYQARATIKHSQSGKVDRVIAYLLRSNTYTADVLEIKVDENCQVVSIIEGAQVADEDEDQ